MTSCRSHALSSRWRVAAPLALAGTLTGRRAWAAAQSTDPGSQNQDALTSLLALVPASAVGPAGYQGAVSGQIATFADLAAQLASGDIALPDSIADEELVWPWLDAIDPLAIAEPFRTHGLKPREATLGRETLGFDMTDVDQTLVIDQPFERITFLRGRFDRDAVRAAWDANGYRLLEVGETEVASLSEGPEFDLSTKLGRIFQDRANNATFLPDGTLAYASSLPLLRSVIEAAAKHGEGSLAEEERVAALLRTLDEPLASAILCTGEALSYAAMKDLLDQETADEIARAFGTHDPMPPIALLLVGMTPGGPTAFVLGTDEPKVDLPPATIVYRVLMVEPGTAVTAARVADERLRTMDSLWKEQPYAHLFASWTAEAMLDGNVLGLNFVPAEEPPLPIGAWSEMLSRHDVLFLAW